jgi:hypothetical protein
LRHFVARSWDGKPTGAREGVFVLGEVRIWLTPCLTTLTVTP